jgi:hypothetical protein
MIKDRLWLFVVAIFASIGSAIFWRILGDWGFLGIFLLLLFAFITDEGWRHRVLVALRIKKSSDTDSPE